LVPEQSYDGDEPGNQRPGTNLAGAGGGGRRSVNQSLAGQTIPEHRS